MLVYANHLEATGKGAKECVLKAVGGWLKEQLDYGLHPTKLVVSGEHNGNRNGVASWVKIGSATDQHQQLYSWVLKNADDAVHGRQWVTEIGLKVFNDACEISCVVNTEEASTLVSESVQASRPRFIRYVVSNLQNDSSVKFGPQVPGLAVKHVGDNEESYRGLLYEIEEANRDYPIVLVSPTKEEEYLVKANHLQQDLVGLAQVVEVDSGFDSYVMEEILGKRWSAWDGAVNILHMPTQNGYVRSRVFLSDVIELWGETQHDRISQILAWVTHNTNIPRLRKRIRPEGVMSLALRQTLKEARDRREKLDESGLRDEVERLAQAAQEQNKWVALLEETNTNLENEAQQLRLDVDEKNEELSLERNTVRALKEQLRNAGTRTSDVDGVYLLNMICRADEPEPLECLTLIETVYGGNCEILESAKKSAKESNRFKQSRQLLDLLVRLVTKYREVLMEKGDSEARKVFGRREFAAKESETVMSSTTLSRTREFEYKGANVEMFRHLKIGIADDPEKTIRVHFHWDHNINKVIIGYCGEHLPVSSH